LRLGGELVLACHGLLHVLEQLGNQRLAIFNLLFVLIFFDFKFLREIIDFLFFLVEDFVLLLITLVALIPHVRIDFFDILLIGVDRFLHVHLFLLELFKLYVVLFDAILEALSGFVKRKVQVVCLQL
jgi:hypothetical protein